MSNHLRYCPQHKKLRPCPHCALAAKPAQVPPVAVMDPPPKSASAIRAQEWREEQKKKNPNFDKEEAERKQQKRKETEQDPADWSKRHPEFPPTLAQLRAQDKFGSLLMKNAPHGKGELVPYGGSDEIESLAGRNTADAEMSELPRRAQLTDEELQKKLTDTTVELQEKINFILEHWKHDKEFCALLNSWSLEEISAFVERCSENLDYARELLYEHTEHQACAQVLTHAQPHGRRVTPEGVSDNIEDDLPEETEETFTDKINPNKVYAQTLRIGGRNAKFYYLNGDAEKHFEDFVRENVDPQLERDEHGELVLPDSPMVCHLCLDQIAPKFSLESGFRHFGWKHRKAVVEHIRWHEAKAWRPTKRVCDRDHAALAAKRESDKEKLYCGTCGKLVFKPEKPKKPKRSDTSKEPVVAACMAA